MNKTMEQNFPNFLCVGAQKCATTTLADMMRLHPDVFVPEKKELHYFDQENYDYNNQATYSAFFDHSDSYKIRVEFSPTYLYFEEVAPRILELLGKEVKILIMLRHPVDRAFSQYTMTSSYGVENQSFRKAFDTERVRVQQNADARKWYSYFERGLYSKQVQQYLDLFDNVKVVLFDDFVQHNQDVMNEIYDFLAIEHCDIPLTKSNSKRQMHSTKLWYAMKKHRNLLAKINILTRVTILKKAFQKVRAWNENPTKDKKIEPIFAKELQQYFYQDICDLEVLLDRDLSSWKNKY